MQESPAEGEGRSMGYFKDVQTCDEHGFALSPEGDCVRCRSEAAAVEQRYHLMRLATGGAIVLLTIVGVGTAWARRAGAAPAPVAAAPAPPPPVEREVRVAASDPSPPAQSAHDIAWEMALAKAQVEEEQKAAPPLTAAQPQAPRVIETTTTTTTYVVQRGPRITPPSPDPTDAWWNEKSRTTMTRSRGVYGGNAARSIANAGAGPNGAQNPAAWGLPANQGGNFTNKSGAH